MFLVNLIRKLQVSFTAKVFFFTLSVVIGLSLLFPLIFIPYAISDRTDSAIKEGTLLCRLLAYSSRIAVYSETEGQLSVAANGILANDNVDAVFIYAADGRTLFQEKKQRTPVREHRHSSTDSPKEQREMAALSRSIVGVIHRKTPRGMEFLAPVRVTSETTVDDADYWGGMEKKPRDQNIGVVRIQLHDAEIQKSIVVLITISCALTLICILAASAVAYQLARSVTSPLKRLSTVVTALGAEGTLRPVPVETCDEIGQVAEAFNGLIDSLQRREYEKGVLEEQLRHSQRLEALGTLAGGIAHDFNTILMAIIGFTELLQKSAGEQPIVRQYGEQIKSSAGKASQLITRLLAFSRKQVVNPRIIDLNDVIRGMEDILLQVVTSTVTLELVLDPEPMPVLLDANQFDQVLLNLATNARDAMPDGGVLRITTGRTTTCEETCGSCSFPHGWCAVLTVTDTGQGLPDAIREKIFDPFFTTKEIGKGTGLGLSMVYGIIQQHSGSICAKGGVGGGTTFTICLPGQNANRSVGELPVIRNTQMVVADSDPVMRHRVGQLLDEWGASFREAEDSQEAIRLCSMTDEPVDVLFIDILMKGAKGAYEEIRRVRPEIRFIFLGGKRRAGAMDEDIPEAGIVTICRPLEEQELKAKLMKVLGIEGIL